MTVARQVGAAENDAPAQLGKATITLSQAVAAAETQIGGKATMARLDDEDGAGVFEVEVVTPDGKVLDVKVGAADAKVLSSKIDLADNGDDEEND